MKKEIFIMKNKRKKGLSFPNDMEIMMEIVLTKKA